VQTLGLKGEEGQFNPENGDCKPAGGDSEAPRKLNKVFSGESSDFQTAEKIQKCPSDDGGCKSEVSRSERLKNSHNKHRARHLSRRRRMKSCFNLDEN
jgi:hypothetical protein